MGLEKDVVEQLKRIEGVAEAHAVYGIYDVYAKVEADEKTKLDEIVSLCIRRLYGIRSTSTLIVRA